jgi:hypothetical protein
MLCRMQVEPIHGWMMRHDCPFSMMGGAMRPLPIARPMHPARH